MAQIHISYSRHMPIEYAKEIARQLEGYGHKVTYWDKKLYNEKYIEEADAVVFVLPDNAWELKRDKIPIGMEVELLRALKFKKDLFLRYITRAGESKIYKAEFQAVMNRIVGEGGSAEVIKHYKKAKLSNCVVMENPCKNVKGRVHPLDDDADYFPPIEVRPDIIHGYAYKQIPVILLRRRL